MKSIIICIFFIGICIAGMLYLNQKIKRIQSENELYSVGKIVEIDNLFGTFQRNKKKTSTIKVEEVKELKQIFGLLKSDLSNNYNSTIHRRLENISFCKSVVFQKHQSNLDYLEKIIIENINFQDEGDNYQNTELLITSVKEIGSDSLSLKFGIYNTLKDDVKVRYIYNGQELDSIPQLNKHTKNSVLELEIINPISNEKYSYKFNLDEIN